MNALLRRALLAAAALLLSACASKPPPAEPAGWRTLAPGLLYWTGEPGLHALRLDLREPRLALRLTPDAAKGQPIDKLPGGQEALAAVNASFYGKGFVARGFTVSNGQAWPNPLEAQNSPLLACDLQQRCALQLAPPYELPPNTHTAVAGTPWLVKAGQARSPQDDASCPDFCQRTHPRTALGLSQDGRYLILLLAEGRREGMPGLSLAATAAQLLRLGAHEALNLDGGGSSSLLIQGQSAMQRPTQEPTLRRIANALLIEAR
jgi:exopolysaccharide biosynthesis protein